MIELGIFGWMLRLCFRTALLVWAARLAMTGNSRPVRAAAVLALPVIAVAVYLGNGVFAAPIWNAMFWFCVGILVLAQLVAA